MCHMSYEIHAYRYDFFIQSDRCRDAEGKRDKHVILHRLTNHRKVLHQRDVETAYVFL